MKALFKFLSLAILCAACFAIGWFVRLKQEIDARPFFICKQDLNPTYADCFPDQDRVDALLKNESARQNLDWRFAKAVLIKESRYVDYAVSGVGAVGLMQLMPRDGSHFTTNYHNMMRARKQKRDAEGRRWYRGRTARQWAKAYQQELWKLIELYKDRPEELYKRDRRFDPVWNIQSGVAQLARDYKKFRKRGHGEYGAMTYAAAAYNAGPGAVAVLKEKRRHDRIPVNHQTEYYVATVMKLYKVLKKGDGRVRWQDRRVLYE